MFLNPLLTRSASRSNFSKPQPFQGCDQGRLAHLQSCSVQSFTFAISEFEQGCFHYGTRHAFLQWDTNKARRRKAEIASCILISIWKLTRYSINDHDKVNLVYLNSIQLKYCKGKVLSRHLNHCWLIKKLPMSFFCCRPYSPEIMMLTMFNQNYVKSQTWQQRPVIPASTGRLKQEEWAFQVDLVNKNLHFKQWKWKHKQEWM